MARGELRRPDRSKADTAATVIQTSGGMPRSLVAALDADTRRDLEEGRFFDVDSRREAEEGSQTAVVAHERLQDLIDYRQALQAWFKLVGPGGRLVITVPHAFLYDRALRLEDRRRPDQKRLYTPASLLQEVEEALPPNTYRVRTLMDADFGYEGDTTPEPTGVHHLVLVLQKTVCPPLNPKQAPDFRSDAPVPEFDRPRTRLEFSARAPQRRILVLKLDHLGDFVMGLPALDALRAAFPSSEITLVVGSWNLDLAEAAGVADKLVVFDVFPRNSSEERVDIAGKITQFEALFKGPYDIAIDLRVDPDTRVLLQNIDAATKAGIGARNRFPFLDVFLPVDFNREGQEQARIDLLRQQDFQAKDELKRSSHRLYCDGSASQDNALVWGPYWSLRAGRYVFEPALEIESEGSLVLDIGLDAQRRCGLVVPTTEPLRLPFEVTQDHSQFEFRIWPMYGAPLPAFSFYGGRLIREGANSVLHQSEYGRLLVELLRMRAREGGLLYEQASF